MRNFSGEHKEGNDNDASNILLDLRKMFFDSLMKKIKGAYRK